MLSSLIKIPVKLALAIFFRHINSPDAAPFKQGGPVLIIANHPNSFLDAIIIGSRFNRPVHFLARGDAFKKRMHRKILGMLNMIPVYRLSEGKESLPLNDYAFHRCKEILSANGIVLIFIEGICRQTHQLQPFKKGAARIAIKNKNLPDFKIIPIGIAYASFYGPGKSVAVLPGKIITTPSLFPYEEPPKNMLYFNEQLFEELMPLIQIPVNAHKAGTKNPFVNLAGCIGYILHLPLYCLLKKLIAKKTKGTVFYDSVLFSSLFLVYPVYLLFIVMMLSLLHVSLVIIVLVMVVHAGSSFAISRSNIIAGR